MTQMIELVDRDSKTFPCDLEVTANTEYIKQKHGRYKLVNLNAYQQKLSKMKHKKKITGE